MVPRFCPDHALCPGAATDIRHLEWDVLRPPVPIEEPNHAILDRTEAVYRGFALALLGVIVVKLLMGGMVPPDRIHLRPPVIDSSFLGFPVGITSNGYLGRDLAPAEGSDLWFICIGKTSRTSFVELAPISTISYGIVRGTTSQTGALV
jgi:hypothetical protein